MKVLIVDDIKTWAIGALTDGIMRYASDRIEFINISAHPRDYMQAAMEIKQLLKHEKIDLWHCMYWNSGEQLMTVVPELRNIPKVLSHHNHNSLTKGDWRRYNAVVAPTRWSEEELKKSHTNVVFIPYGIDLDVFSYLPDYPYTKEKTIGYIGRVMPHKNLAKISEAATKLDYKVVGSGYIDDPRYWETVDKSHLEFNGGVGRQGMMPKQYKDQIYRRMQVFCMYSTGENETGTLPLLEAMARGIPVMATAQGMARDLIIDGENGIIFTEENFESKLKTLMEDEKLRQRLRVSAWETIKNYTEERMARDYVKLYYKIVSQNKKTVSVVIPTFNRADTLVRMLASIEASEYPAKEIIVSDDGSTDHTALAVREFKKQARTPIRYIRTSEDESYYGLARARNIGAVESVGDILLFMDDRYTIEPDAIGKIAESSMPNVFCFGKKIIRGKLSTKNVFMENFAWINRKDFFKAGMFNERINKYGGLSQETRDRFKLQGFSLNQVKSVVASEIKGSSKKARKRNEIWRMKLLIHKMYN